MEKFGLLALNGGGGGGGLPPVTSSDNGKVLAVENGSWAAADKSPLVVTYTITGQPSGDVYPLSTATSYASIVAALTAGREVVAALTYGTLELRMRLASIDSDPSSGYVSFSTVTRYLVDTNLIAWYQIVHSAGNIATGLIIPLITGTMEYNSGTNTLAFTQ